MADDEKKLMERIIKEPNFFLASNMLTDAIYPVHIAEGMRRSNEALEKGDLVSATLHPLGGAITQAVASAHEFGTDLIDKIAGIKPIPQEVNKTTTLLPTMKSSTVIDR